ncbi:MAG TPA: nuclear transport factor 2 family protein [Pyrinomonadaceae bacterium]
MKSGNEKEAEEDQIRDRLQGWVKAVRAKDVDAVMSYYAPDTLLFDLAPPLQYRGAELCRKNWAEWFSTFRGSVGYEISELEITSGNDLAFCHSLNHIHGLRTDNEHTDVWVRATIGLRKLSGQWMITHEHYSVPFYMDPPYKASLDLKP